MRVHTIRRKTHPAPYEVTDVMRRIVNTPIPTGFEIIAPSYRPIEFDITCTNPTATTGRNYVMVWTNGIGSGLEQAVEFTDAANLNYKLNNHIGITTISGIGCKYSSIFWDDDTSLFYYIFNYDPASTALTFQIRGVSATSIADLASKLIDVPTMMANSVLIGRMLGDPTFRKLSDGRYILTGHNNAEPFIWTNTDPLGEMSTWTKHGVASKNYQRLQQSLSYAWHGPADPSLHIDGDDVYLIYNGIPYNHTEYMVDNRWYNRIMIVQLDPNNDFAIKGATITPFHIYQQDQLGIDQTTLWPGHTVKYIAFGNPVFVQEATGLKIYCTNSSEGGKMIVWHIPDTPAPIDEVMCDNKWAVLYDGGEFERATNMHIRQYGTTTVTGSGLQVSGNNSGCYGFLRNMNLTDCLIQFDFILDALPTAQDGVLISIIAENNTKPFEITVRPNADIIFNGTNKIGNAVVGQNNIRLYKRKSVMICGEYAVAINDFDSCIFSLFNRKKDIEAPSGQLNGLIQHFSVRLDNHEINNLFVEAVTGAASAPSGTSVVHTVTLNNKNGGLIWYSQNSMGGLTVIDAPTFSNGVKVGKRNHTNGVQTLAIPKGVDEFTITTPQVNVGEWALFVDTIGKIIQST